MSYEKIKYPDGQISAKVTELDQSKTVFITERINNYEDLIFVLSLAQVYRRLGKKVVLTIPCLFAQRSDRMFSNNQSFDLQLVASILNSAKFKEVRILDPHSSVALALINNSVALTVNSFISDVLYDIERRFFTTSEGITLVSPDAGAYKKVFDLAQMFEMPLVASVKHRDLQGKIDLTFTGDVKGRNCLIVDDLLDGGYTFAVLAEQLKARGANKVFLYVTHGFFHKGFDFSPHIDHFYCTNSVKKIDNPKVTQFEVI